MSLSILWLGLLLVGPVLAVAAGEPVGPLEFVEQQARDFEDLCRLPPDERGDALRTGLREVFDFDGFAARSLGRHAAAFDEARREEFALRLRTVIEDLCLAHRETIFGGQRYRIGAAQRDGALASVSGSVAGEDVDFDVVLRLRRAGDGWRVEDVVIDQLSLLESYRSQFTRYLEEHAPEDLLELLRTRSETASPGEAP